MSEWENIYSITNSQLELYEGLSFVLNPSQPNSQFIIQNSFPYLPQMRLKSQ
jgi:hypothetical protein